MYDEAEMERRIIRAELEIEQLRRAQERLGESVVSIRERQDANHSEVMQAIGSLRDDRARHEGAMEERLQAAQRTRDRMKMISTVLAIIGGMVTLGWLGDARGDVYASDKAIRGVQDGSETRRSRGTAQRIETVRD